LSYESARFGKEDVRQVQSYSPERRGESDLRKPKAQATAGIIYFDFALADYRTAQDLAGDLKSNRYWRTDSNGTCSWS
jgi:hypothetical protein